MKQTHFVMLHHHNANGHEVWLEQRPQTGIWGGLFCFPQTEHVDIESDIDLLLEQRGIQARDIKDQQTLITFRHTFSHYHLDITPILIDLSKQPDVVMEDNKGLWYNLSQPEEVGLAAPVKLLLEALPHELR